MSDQDHNNNIPPQRRKRESSPNPSVVITIIILLVFAVSAGIIFLNGSRNTDKFSPPPDRPQKSQLAQRPEIQPEHIQEAQPESAEPDGISSETDTREQIEEPGIPGPVTENQIESEQNLHDKNCQLLGDKLYNFFIHIDSEEYIKSFELKESSQDHFIKLAYKLLANPPVVTRESDDLYTILKNMAHFFRTIGKDNIILVKTILDRERDKIEDVASELYQWVAYGDCENDRFTFKAPLEQAYEYAGFFLNTMGGRSYLFRRDSRSRLIVNYYSILIVASANERGLNRHGIDISLLLPQLVQEIEATNQLIYKENYLDQLYDLMEKYQ